MSLWFGWGARDGAAFGGAAARIAQELGLRGVASAWSIAGSAIGKLVRR
jgi:hypothetical protein